MIKTHFGSEGVYNVPWDLVAIVLCGFAQHKSRCLDDCKWSPCVQKKWQMDSAKRLK